MPIFVRDAGVWKEPEPFVRDAGVWKPLDTGHVRDAGAWKQFYAGGAAPFILSGSFETGLEGWALSGGASRVNLFARTGSWCIYAQSSIIADYTLPAGSTAGLVITASAYHRFGYIEYGSVWARILVSKDGGAFQQIEQHSSTESWKLLSGSTAGTGGVMVIRIEVNGPAGHGGNEALLDDWKIEGVNP